MRELKKIVTDKYKWFWIVLIIGIPFMELFLGVDVSDVGFSLNQYKYVFSDIDSIYLPLLLTDVIGYIFHVLFDALSIPAYLGFKLLWVISGYYLCWLSCRLYKRYRNDSLILPALAFAMLFAKTNFNFFIYNTTVAVMALTALYFLIISLNDQKPFLLLFSVLFFVLAALCKISALMQFCVFGILFYDLYLKRDWKYFWRQILYCVVGFLAGISMAAILLYFSCGIGNYINMVIDMFFYAGNSTDGHTIGNMIIINIKGTMHGVLIIGVLWLICLIGKKIEKHSAVSERFIKCGLLAAAVLIIIGKFVGLDKVPGLGAIYGIIFNFYNALAVAVSLIYVCMIGIIRERRYSKEFKMLTICAGVLTIVMPIGSNVGITHICNEFFFALPFIFIYLRDKICLNMKEIPEKADTHEKRQMTLAAFLTSMTAIWMILFTAWQSVSVGRMYRNSFGELAAFQIDELRFMKSDVYSVEMLEELVEFMESRSWEDTSLLAVGALPLVNYLTDIKPAITGCGGWIETDYVTAEEIAEQLADIDELPVVVMKNDCFLPENQTDKVNVVLEFIDKSSYDKVFTNEEYSVYTIQGL